VELDKPGTSLSNSRLTMTFLIALGVPLLGLGCIITGLIYIVGAIWAGVFEGGGPRVTQRLERGLIWLFAGSLLGILDVIGAWTNPNEKIHIARVVIGYAAFTVPLAAALFVGGLALRRSRVGTAMTLYATSFIVWSSTAWAQVFMLWSWIAFALFYR
jgi:hypothetical protein